MSPAEAMATAVTTAIVAAMRVRTGIGPQRHRRRVRAGGSVVAPLGALAAFVVIHVLAGVLAGVVVPVILSRIGLVSVACLVEPVGRGELPRLRGDNARARSGIVLLAWRGLRSWPVVAPARPVVVDVTRPADDDRTAAVRRGLVGPA